MKNAEIENCLSDFKELLSKNASSSSLFTLILGDINAKSSSRWEKDKTTVAGTHAEALTFCITFIN